jgi:hypothetical protein
VTRTRWIAISVGGVVVAWFAALLAIDAIGGDRVARGVAERIGDSLQSSAAFTDRDLALVRGRLDLAGLHVTRDDAVGQLRLDVAGIRCELAPLGIAFVDRDCDELAIRGMRLDVSTIALFKLRPPKRRPIHADSVTIDDATFSFAAGAITPTLGEVRVVLERAIAGATTFKTPLSWLFALRGLRAHVALSDGQTVDVTFANGVVQVSGSLLGEPPLVLPLELPVTTAADDGRSELAKLTAFGRLLAERLIAERWLRHNVGGGQPR